MVPSALTYAPAVIPRATYRLQLNRDFRFRDVKNLLSYLSGLGISHLYLSPIFKASSGSMHGYDVVDHAEINPELGSREEFDDLATAARAHGLGIIQDIVPNHMAIYSNDNAWWLDVLENGPAAKSAACFDIDWRPVRASMRNRLLVPILENLYGEELRQGSMQLHMDEQAGSFFAQYRELRFPIDPRLYPMIFERSAALTSSDTDAAGLRALMASFAELPARDATDPSSVNRRYRDKETLKSALVAYCRRRPVTRKRIDVSLAALNDVTNHRSLRALGEILEAQAYRLASWKVACDEINYRRFFDVNQLAALRATDPRVFAATHKLVIDLLAARRIDGVRVDHVDGLDNPAAYLRTLQTAVKDATGRQCYVVVEKILATHERLREDWPIAGTTGYDFGAAVCSWLSARDGLAQVEQSYRQYTRQPIEYPQQVRECKQLLMRTSLTAEVSVLAVRLDRIAQMHRDTLDFTHFALREALMEVIAAFPIYRTYVSDAASPEDERAIAWAIGAARSLSPNIDRSIFSFLHAVFTNTLTGDDDPRTPLVREFIGRFQQATPAVMAKAVEDTVFYRYCHLLAMNDVGSDPHAPNLSTSTLLKSLGERALRWPYAMLGTSTHDSKRGEDVRFRLVVLSEMPKLWRRFAVKAGQLNRRSCARIGGKRAPSRNDEYLLLQTLLGMWPLDSPSDDPAAALETTIARLKQYATKALREAKQHTSWINPDSEYEAACLAYIEGLLVAPRRALFMRLLNDTLSVLAPFGLCNTLSALVLKLTSPGVPDFYQGSEFLDLTLVDPDNRQPVDFSRRASLLQELLDGNQGANPLADPVTESWRASAVKLSVAWRLLQLRRDYVDLFASGSFEPLEIRGDRSQHVCAFVRSHGQQAVVVIVTRWIATLCKSDPRRLHPELWEDTHVLLPPQLCARVWVDYLITQQKIVGSSASVSCLFLRDVLVKWPIAVLHIPLNDPSGSAS